MTTDGVRVQRAMDAASVRVDATSILSYGGRVVRIIGKASAVNGDSVKLDANGQVNVSTNANDKVEIGKIYEVIGKVNVSDHRVTSYSVMRLSDDTNLEAASKLAQYVQKVPELFQ